MELEMFSIVHSGQVDILGSPHNWHISVNIESQYMEALFLSIINKF